MINITVYY